MFLTKAISTRIFVISLASILAACSEGDTKENEEQMANLPVLEIYKQATCHCCHRWISHMQKNGFETKAHNKSSLSGLKSELGIEPRYQSCHTAVSKEGFVFEGHIPARIIHQFLKEKPKGAIGLAVPAMPVGSPGMESGTRFRPYSVLLLKTDASVEVYAQIKTQEEQYQ